MTGLDGKQKLSRRDGTENKNCHYGTERFIFFSRWDRTAHNFFDDGTGRYIISSTTRSDDTTFFSTTRDGTFFFHDGTGRYAYFFTAQESAMQNTLTSAPRQQCYKLQVIAVRRILPSYNIRYHTCVINGCKFVRSNL